MSDASNDELLVAIELHSEEKIRALLDGRIDVCVPIKGKLPVDWLTEMYSRSDRFPRCLQLLVDRGAVLRDPVLAPVLLNDVDGLLSAVRADRTMLTHRTDLVSSFTPLIGASLLHVAAEYGHANVASALMELGADVNATAAIDKYGMNGHTPIFHTVNAHGNRSAPIMQMLLDAGARTDVTLRGITWGQSFAWETTFFDVTPISYAQCGLFPQMHRSEADIYDNIARLLSAAGRELPPLPNIPNRYLEKR